MPMMRLAAPFLLGTFLALPLVAPKPAMGAYVVERFTGDSTFTTRCGGTACEFAVSEGRAGNVGTTGTFEVVQGVPTTLTGPEQTAGGGTAQFAGWPNDASWSLTYNASGQTLTFTVPGSNPTPLTALNLDLSQATGIFVRVAGFSLTETGEITDLSFNSDTDGTLNLGSLGPATGSGPAAEYLAFAGFDTMANWTLSGVATLIGGSQARPSFQIKMTDAAVVPIPAALPLMLTGLAGLGYLGYRRRITPAAG